MLKILLSGAGGAMGKNVAACALQQNETIVAGVDKQLPQLSFPVYTDFGKVKEKADVIIDFSNVSVLDGLLEYAVANKTPVVIATTGYSEKQLLQIEQAAKVIPVFKTANLSLGVNVIRALVSRAAKMLEGFDIEIVEKHHHNKVDAPSGTALLLADAANAAAGGNMEYEYDRHAKRAKRRPSEIGIHSVRGGTIVGVHDVIFAGENEVVTISHEAQSRGVFAAGALKAANFIIGQKPGIYDMNDLLGL